MFLPTIGAPSIAFIIATALISIYPEVFHGHAILAYAVAFVIYISYLYYRLWDSWRVFRSALDELQEARRDLLASHQPISYENRIQGLVDLLKTDESVPLEERRAMMATFLMEVQDALHELIEQQNKGTNEA